MARSACVRSPVSAWFRAEHSFGEFRGRGAAMLETVVDKLES